MKRIEAGVGTNRGREKKMVKIGNKWDRKNNVYLKNMLQYVMHIYLVQVGLCHGGLTPALAPRMPVITEDVGKSRP